MLRPVRQLHLYHYDTFTVSKWIVEVVNTTYFSSYEPMPDKITTHELHALASSWAYLCHVALKDMFSAAYWQSAGVFQNNYLGDSAPIAGDMSTLLSVVVVQHSMDARIL